LSAQRRRTTPWLCLLVVVRAILEAHSKGLIEVVVESTSGEEEGPRLSGDKENPPDR
jgi:hypothetical protein